MNEEIKQETNCIIKAFENNPIAIISEHINGKKIYYFKASDIAKALKLSNIAVSIQHYDEDERVIRKAYDTLNRYQDIIFLTSQGVYRVLYNSKKPEAKKFRKWVGNILDDIIFNESNELRIQLENHKLELKDRDKLIEQLENKPETEGFKRDSGDVYMVEDKEHPGRIKIGFATKTNERLEQLNVGSSCKSLELYAKFETFDKVLAEKLIHHCLQPFRIRNRREWFFFKNDLELSYAIHSIKKILEFIKIFDIKDYQEFKDITINLDIKNELIKKEDIKENMKELKENLQMELDNKREKTMKKRKEVNLNNIQQSSAQTGTFKGACWVAEKKQWKSELGNNNKHFFLGYYSDEIDAAKVYNDYALFLNETENTNFLLNNIPGYINVARNIPEENAKRINDNLTSKYTGVSYDSKRKYYVCGIKLAGKTYNLGSSKNPIDCARLYNQQALYFNNEMNTKYILNDLGEETLPKDIRTELSMMKQAKKTSNYYGVSLSTTKKWVCSYTMNRKKVHIGTFNTELEACMEYNKVVIELNKNGCTYKINII